MSNAAFELWTTIILVVVIAILIAGWNIVSGCYVKTEKGWIPREEMSKRAIANDVQTN